MIGIQCEKSTIERYMHVFGSGHGDISEPSGGWNANELLTLAGCCFAAAYRQGPQIHGVLGADPNKTGRQDLSPEQLHRDIRMAIEFCEKLAIEAADNTWDKKFGAQLRASIEGKASGTADVMPLEGFKENWKS